MWMKVVVPRKIRLLVVLQRKREYLRKGYRLLVVFDFLGCSVHVFEVFLVDFLFLGAELA